MVKFSFFPSKFDSVVFVCVCMLFYVVDGKGFFVRYFGVGRLDSRRCGGLRTIISPHCCARFCLECIYIFGIKIPD